MLKMKTLSKLGAATAVAALMATGASAAVTSGVIPGGGTNEALAALGLSDPLGGWYGASLWLTELADITIDYFGAEAGYNNSFIFGDDDAVISTGGNTNEFGSLVPTDTPLSSKTVTGVMAGQLDFGFGMDGSLVATLLNGNNPNGSGPSSPPNFFVSFVGNPNATSGSSVWLFLDDGGAGPDDNHDDMVIRLTASAGSFVAPIPVPAAGFLLLGGLAALGMVSRRRKSV